MKDKELEKDFESMEGTMNFLLACVGMFIILLLAPMGLWKLIEIIF